MRQGNCRGGRSASLYLLSLSVSRPSFPSGDDGASGANLGQFSVGLFPGASIRQLEVPMNSAQSGAHFPVQHRSVSLEIKGTKTDIVISTYEDTFLVIVTQIGCMGTILAANKDESVFSDPTYNVSVLFGKRDEPLLLACARQLIEHIRYTIFIL
ncbi:proteasome assembly chaperone 3-like isoform X2 [Panicum hallii]|uniref:proteasome assembly chaperone 3-like isoform X2 n=1 Tax=Panicum hallii TaxID=206008 RepID=UPI000DF4EA75|nr:proteasome assembly chaperone 3-like isoform X2 [Panicum hallii]